MSDAPAEPQPIEIDEPFSLTEFADADVVEHGEPERRSPVRRIVLSALAAVTVAALGTIGYAAWQMSSQKDATLNTPATIGSLRLDQSDDGKSTAEYLQTALNAEMTLKQSVGAVYDDTPDHQVLFFGGTATIWSPEKQLNSTFDLIADNQGAVTGLHKVDAGHFGGTMKCGTTKSDNTNLAVCGWADHGSLALAMFPNRTETDAAKLLLQIRDATQTRN